MVNNMTIYKWCKQRFDYYEYTVSKTIHELWDDVRIMLAREDRVKGDKSFFATFMFGQCKKHENQAWLVVLADTAGWYCADRNYLYHPVQGPLPIKDFTVAQYSNTGDSWNSI